MELSTGDIEGGLATSNMEFAEVGKEPLRSTRQSETPTVEDPSEGVVELLTSALSHIVESQLKSFWTVRTAKTTVLLSLVHRVNKEK